MRVQVFALAAVAMVAVAMGDDFDDIMRQPNKDAAGLELPKLLKKNDISLALPGATTRLVDLYREVEPNPLFLTSLPGKLWWNVRSQARLSVLVTEPIGLLRLNQAVSVFYTFPPQTVPESIRVVMPYGKEIPSQVRVIDAKECKFEVVFLIARLDAAAQMPLFIYYGNEAIDVPRPVDPDVCFRTEVRKHGVALINDRLQAEVSKVVSQDRYAIWRQLKAHGSEFNMVSTFPTAPYGTPVSTGTVLQVLEDGPVRKTVSYGKWGEGYTISIYADSPLLYVASQSGNQCGGFWLPGGDTLNDVLCYESVEGLKRMPISYTGGNAMPCDYKKLKDWYKEGWMAFLDEARQQGVGWFFDFPKSRISLQTLPYGYLIGISAPGQSALYVAPNASTEACREAYMAWKCPPIVSLGARQSYSVIAPHVPMLGKDFIRMQMLLHRYRPRDSADAAREIVEDAQMFGANYLAFQAKPNECLVPSVGADGKPGPSLLDELVRECHLRGMGKAQFPGPSCNMPLLRDLIKRGVDAVWLADEWGWRPDGYYPLNEEQRKQFLAGTWNWSHTNFSAAERVDFKKRYGAEMPDKPEKKKANEELANIFEDKPEVGGLMASPVVASKYFQGLSSTNLADPSQRAMFHMLIDGYNRLMADMAAVARENNSNVFVTATTSPNNLMIGPNMQAFHDMETLADSFSSIALDLYSNDAVWLNSMVKYARGMQGNRRAIFVIGGYCGWDNRRMVENNLNFQVMMGANSLCYFVQDRICAPWAGLGSKDAYELIDYTGLGDFAATSWPLEFAGVIRDRDEFFAGMERGETVNANGVGSLYENSVLEFVKAFGVNWTPVNVIAAKHLKTELGYPYKVIVVPDNPTLSEANAGLLRDYVEAGGCLIIEGATIRNSVMAKLAKVTAAGKVVSGALTLTGVKAPLEKWTCTFTGLRQPIKAEAGADVLATVGEGEPAITVAAAGKGKVYVIAPRIGPQAARKPVAEGLLRLTENAVGAPPVQVEPAGANVFTTVLTDGKRYVIGAYSGAVKPYDNLTFVLKGFPEGLNQVVSLRTGRSYPIVYGRVANITLQPDQVDFFMTPPSLASPQVFRQTQKPINQSIQTGMKFLDLPPLSGNQEAK